jgi:transcriptional regulator GlxA family with amidase domain
MTYFSNFSGPPEPLRVGFICFDGMAAVDLTGPLEALTIARHPAELGKEAPCYRPMILGLTGRSFVSESGIRFRADATADTAESLDTILIPGGRGLRDPEISRLVAAWLNARAAATRRIASISTGLYALAQSGLVDGQSVTTHWRFAGDIARRFPKVHLNPVVSFLKNDRFYTSGGGSAGVEMTLALIEEDFGNQIARTVARELVLRLRPPGENDVRFESTNYQSDPSERITELPAWILAHLNEKLTVEALAQRACLCPRHFSRVFKQVFNCTPADFVEELRLSEARRRLLGLRASVESVAESVGFNSSDAFRRAFERRVGTTPSIFRRQARGEQVPGKPSSVPNGRTGSRLATAYPRRLAA